MTKEAVDLGELIATRDRVIGDIQSRMDEDAKRFLRTLHDGAPALTRSTALKRPSFQP